MMKKNHIERRTLLLAATSLALAATQAMAQGSAADYPNKPIRIMVSVPAGGAADTLARIVGEKLQAKWGQTVVVDNKSGAGGNIAAEYVAQSPPDGYTLLITPPGPLTINKFLYKNLKYDPDKFAMISIIAANPNVLLINPKIPATNLAEFITYAKAHPGKLNFASGGIGSTPHLTGELFKQRTGIDISHIPYKGGPPAYADLLGGQVEIMFQGLATALPNIQDGKLRVLAVGGDKRYPLLPDVPALNESMPGFVSTSWTGFAAPPGTPQAIVDKLQAALSEGLRQQVESGKAVKGLDARDVIANTPVEATKFANEEKQRWEGVIRASGATAD